MPRMADFPNEYRDLLDAQFATLATVEPDGTPPLSEIWSSTTTARSACR